MEKGGEECYGLHGLFCSPPPPLHTYMLCYLPFQLLGPLVHHCEELPGNQAPWLLCVSAPWQGLGNKALGVFS